jgi:cytoskeletal protein RodZ
MSAGALLRATREKAGIPVSKLSADLRIAPATLAALEAGDYGKLPGPPYVRGMLASVARYLRIDTREILKVYAEEAGDQEPATSTISPYKDDSGTHAKAHKQIFILLLAVLLFILLLIMGKVNTSSPEPEPAAPPAQADTLLNIEPQPDTALADTLADSLAVVDSVDALSPAPAATTSKMPEPAVENPETRVRIVALTDSVWLRVLPAGARESSRYLRLDRPVDFNHDDAITFITRKGGTVRVIAGDNEDLPSQRRFKVDGDQITE